MSETACASGADCCKARPEGAAGQEVDGLGHRCIGVGLCAFKTCVRRDYTGARKGTQGLDGSRLKDDRGGGAQAGGRRAAIPAVRFLASFVVVVHACVG